MTKLKTLAAAVALAALTSGIGAGAAQAQQGLIKINPPTDGRPMPPDPAPTNTGLSVGRWEGETLVVETTAINPRALYPARQQGAVPIGDNVRITERIFLKDPNRLQLDVTTVAPDVLTQPDRRTRLYSRLAKTTPTEITFCTEYDRSIDPATGEQRFDMTPPPDLAPPPSR